MDVPDEDRELVEASTLAAASEPVLTPEQVARDETGGVGLSPGSEIALAALLGVVAWVAAVFVAPVELRFAMLGNPIAVGAAIALILLAGKTAVARRPPAGRDAVMFLVDAVVATIVLYLFLPG